MADRLHNDKRTVRCFPLLRPSFFLFFFLSFLSFSPLSACPSPPFKHSPHLSLPPSRCLCFPSYGFVCRFPFLFLFFFFPFLLPTPSSKAFFFSSSPSSSLSLPVYLFTPFPGILPAQYPPSAPPCSSQALKESQPVVGMMYPSNSDIPPIQRQDETN